MKIKYHPLMFADIIKDLLSANIGSSTITNSSEDQFLRAFLNS